MATYEQPKSKAAESGESESGGINGHQLDTGVTDGHELTPVNPHAPPASALSTWLSVEQIRKNQRMRRETVVAAMLSGELPYEQRGRIRYARLTDVLAWEERRLQPKPDASKRRIHPDLSDLC